jgi:membrane fusion protein, multidrug efflux system
MSTSESQPRGTAHSPRWLGIAVLALCIVGFAAYRHKATLANPPPAASGSMALPVVAAATVVCTDWNRYESFSGVVRASHRADLTTDTAGIVDSVHFDSGKSVQVGELLVQLRLNDGPGVLAETEADLTLAKKNFARAVEQLRLGAISQEEFDSLRHAMEAAKARLAAQRARVEQRSVRAPFAGTVGIRKVDPGQFIQAGDVITTIDGRTPLLFDFSIPQSLLSSIRVGQRGRIEVEGYGKKSFDATVSSLPPIADPQSHNISARATLAGDPQALVSGMFGTIRLVVETLRAVRTIPRSAILSSTHGDTLYLLSTTAKESVVHQVPVAVKDDDGDRAVVEGQFKCNDRIVVSGHIKIEDGARVAVAPHE